MMVDATPDRVLDLILAFFRGGVTRPTTWYQEDPPPGGPTA